MSTLTVQCCVCLRVKTPKARRYGRPAERVLPDASHTYCPACLAAARREIALARTVTPAPAAAMS